jgi:2,5-furandicarboxylate decarboxylase 1
LANLVEEQIMNSDVVLDKDLRGYLETNSDIVTRIEKPVDLDDIGALSAQSEQPILFENIRGYPNFRLCDILVKHRCLHGPILGVSQEDYLQTLAHRLRRPPRGYTVVETGPVKEVVYRGHEVDWTKLPVPIHSEGESDRYITAMNFVRDPETGFYNTSHAGTSPLSPQAGLMSFVTPHTNAVIQKYKARGATEMPVVIGFGVHPAYEVMGNFSGLHMDMWGELDMIGTIMNQDVEMVPAEVLDMLVPAHAEIIVEGLVDLTKLNEFGCSVGPSGYYMPKQQMLPEVHIQAITMRSDRPIYRNHQTCPFTDHQTLPRMCHEAMIYNRVQEIGLNVKEVRFPNWGGVFTCIIQVEAPREGFINDALMACMGAPWLNTKMVVAVSHDIDIEDAEQVYHSIATRCDPARDIITVGNTRGSLYDPSASPMEGNEPWRIVGKIGIDATRKSRFNKEDFVTTKPRNWGKVHLADYLS